ncbi:MAG: hypothetical protein HYZ36_00390, partial [Pedosphaera parvula]|nr:hypothetical protein [Pedosphaera parvula]
NLELAADVARTYYGIKPMRVEGALAAWSRLYRVAAPGVQQQEAALNLARVNMEAGRLRETHEFLAQVTHEFHRANKERLAKRLAEKEHPPKGGAVVPASAEAN